MPSSSSIVDSLVNGLGSEAPLDVRYNAEVTSIVTSYLESDGTFNTKVYIRDSGDVYPADDVIVTVPLGVLKSQNSILFQRPDFTGRNIFGLPTKMKDVISRTGKQINTGFHLLSLHGREMIDVQIFNNE